MGYIDDINTKTNTGAPIDLNEIEKISGYKILMPHNFEYIDGPSTIHRITPHKIIFFDKILSDQIDVLSDDNNNNCLFIVPCVPEHKGIVVPHISVDNPRITYAKLINRIFEYPHAYYDGYYTNEELKSVFPKCNIMPGCKIHKTAKIHSNVTMLPNVFVGPNVVIQESCFIMANTSIGHPGFGIIHSDDTRHVHLPHVGGVEIGRNVEIGANNSICGGTINPTFIDDNVKLDSLVHIAHNVQIGAGTQIAAHTEISGSVAIGKNVWVGPKTSITNGITIGDNVFIGIGSNVTKEILSNSKAVGNPARVIK